VPQDAGVMQLHSAAYRSPSQLPPGAVLVVGAGSSGVQIAEELCAAGRRVYLSVSSHGRPPRAYRGRDYVWWLGILNKWDLEATPESRHVTIAVSGANGGSTVDFRRLANGGITLVGTTDRYDNGTIRFAPDLAENLARGDRDYLAVLDEADAFALANALDLPEEPGARDIPPDPPCVTEPILELNVAATGITSIVWATGYERDYRWLKTDAVDAGGQPIHQRGVSAEPGIYFLGLPWLTRRASSFIWGVWYDAKYIADHIAKQRTYLAYQPTAISGSGS
ncbi:MAG: FAD-dependent oxidoreductase, partial [Ilumatobacteraceae bacterium]